MPSELKGSIPSTIYIVTLALLQVAGLVMFIGGVSRLEWGYVIIGLTVFGSFRWLFQREEERIDKEYRRRFR